MTDSPENTPPKAKTQKTIADSFDVIGMDLGDFKILRHLGSGGMSSVFLAQQKSLHRHVALKLLKPDMLEGDNDTHLKRFSQEAAAAAALNHPNIVQIHSIGEEEGFHYIAQEYVQGINLRQYIERQGPLDLKLAVSFLKQIASALQKAGDVGIVHRDIKPDNILMDRKGKVKVADFGLARLARQEENVNLTQAGTTLGTPLYMSPEQVNGNELDHRSDIYSLGVTTYCMLAGRPPFLGETALAIAVKHLNEKPVPLGRHRPDLPPAFCQLVEKMMAKDVKKRFGNCDEILRQLKQIFPKEIPENSPVVNEYAAEKNKKATPSGQFPDWPISKHLQWFGTVAAVCLLLSAGVGWAMRPGDPIKAPFDAEVPLSRTASEQFLIALDSENPEAEYRKIIDNPNLNSDATYRNLAYLQLGRLLLQKRQFEQAAKNFGPVWNQSDDPQLKAKGLAGNITALTMKGDYNNSHTMITTHLVNLWDELDGDYKNLVLPAFYRNAAELGSGTGQSYQNKFPQIDFEFPETEQ